MAEWLTVKQAAERLNVSGETIRQLVKAQRLTTRPAGLGQQRPRTRIDAASLAAYERMTTTPALAVVPSASSRAPRFGDDAYEKLWGASGRGRSTRKKKAASVRT